MKLNEFEWAMEEMMKDRDYLYGSLTLRSTYTVFMIGIIVSVLAFSFAFLFQSDTVYNETMAFIPF